MFRTVVGIVAVACQLEAEVALRDIITHWYPDFEKPKIPPKLAAGLFAARAFGGSHKPV